MEPSTLTQFYDDLKKLNNRHPVSVAYKVGNGMDGELNPAAVVWRNKAARNCENLKDKCRKHIILDIYAKILPLDDDYVCKNKELLSNDVDSMLACKDMTPTEYLKSCSESTNAEFPKYLLWATDKIGENYMMEAEEELKKAQELDAEIGEPKEPDVEDDDVQGQLVDVKSDMEYDNFVDTLKKKTIDKIVNDISEIIADKKEQSDMEFDTNPQEEPAVAAESTVAVPLDHINKTLWKVNIPFTESEQEEMLGMAIREATLHELDLVFNQPGGRFNEYASNIRFDKGYVANKKSIRKEIVRM